MQEIMLIAILVFSNLYPSTVANTSSALEIIGLNDPVFTSICYVESNFEKTAKGNGCLGIAQISGVCLRDVNKIVGKKRYSQKDCFDVSKSYEIYKIYRDHYIPGEKTVEACAGLWNGGPGGKNSRRVKPYVAKVKQYYIRNKLGQKKGS